MLREIADLLTAHVADEERDVFPLVTKLVSVEDYERLQKRFRGDLKLRLLPFLVCWAARHATAQERPVLVAGAGWPLRVLLKIFESRFRAREMILFSGLSRH